MSHEPHFSSQRLGILLAVSVGIWGSFAWWSVLQERLLTRPYIHHHQEGDLDVLDDKPSTFNFPFFLNLVSYLACVFFAAFLQVAGGQVGWVTPFKQVDPFQSFTMGLTLALGTPFGYSAMRRLAYPVVLAGKMCKAIPTMIVGFFVFRQRYETLKYVGVLMLTFGVIGYSLLGEAKKQRQSKIASESGSGDGGNSSSDNNHHHTSLMGLLLIGINLLFDGYTQSSQDAINKKSNPGSLQMMILANGIAAFFAMCFLTVAEYLPCHKVPVLQDIVMRQEFSHAMNFLMEHPQSLADLTKMACLGAVGQVFIFVGMSYFGALTVMGLTVSRKIGSVFLSIWMHNHSQNGAQQICLVLVVIGIAIDSYLSVMSKKKTHTAPGHHKDHHQHHDDPAATFEHVMPHNDNRKTTEQQITAAASSRRSKKEQ